MPSLLRLSDLAWPCSRADLERDNPATWFPPNLADAQPLSDFGYVLPEPTDPPEHDPAAFQAREVMPVCVDGVWQQAWELDPIAPPPPPTPDFQAFYDALLISSCYGAALQQVMGASTPAPAAALAVLISAIQDCLNGRPNPPALQASIWLLLGQITLSQEHLAELQGLLVAAHLDGLVNLTPPTPGPQP